PAARAWNSMPWASLEPRMIPMLSERRVLPEKLIGIGTGKCAKDYRHTRDVATLRHSEDLTHEPASGRPTPLHVPATGRGRYRSFLIDFGRTVVGDWTLRVLGGRGGEIVDTLHVETIDTGKLRPHLVIPTWCRMAFGNRLICRRGVTDHQFYHPFGFR